jgi:hypothetical protein
MKVIDHLHHIVVKMNLLAYPVLLSYNHISPSFQVPTISNRLDVVVTLVPIGYV